MAVQDQIAIRRGLPRRNVFEVDAQPGNLESERQRPPAEVVAIAPHDPHWRAEQFDLREDLRFTHIPEMPDLIRIHDRLADMRRKPVMRIGDDSDPHKLNFTTSTALGD